MLTFTASLYILYFIYYGGGEAYAWPMCKNQKTAMENELLPPITALRGSNFSHQACTVSTFIQRSLSPAPAPPFTSLYLPPKSSVFLLLKPLSPRLCNALLSRVHGIPFSHIEEKSTDLSLYNPSIGTKL